MKSPEPGSSHLPHPQENWIRRAPGDIDRIEASFRGAAFAPHRHDTYAIGVTLQGVQTFDYRGSTRHSLAGQLVILHPDEVHDGRAGTEEAFRYRTIYVRPSLMQVALGGRALPFIKGGVSDDVRLRKAIWPLLEDLRRPLGALEYEDGICDLAVALEAASGQVQPPKLTSYDAPRLAREFIDDNLVSCVSLETLEVVSGQDRWQLSRDFRAAYGTSPYRYLTMRRLDKAQTLMRQGHSISDTAIACSFSDQSHLTRFFRKAFGMTPKVWLETVH